MIARAAAKMPAPTWPGSTTPGASPLGAPGRGVRRLRLRRRLPRADRQERRRTLVAAADREAAARSRIVFTTARPLFERHAALKPRTHLVPNAGDFEHFARAADRSNVDAGASRPAASGARLRRQPRSRRRSTSASFDALADAFPDATFCSRVPLGRMPAQTMDRLIARSQRALVGMRSYESFPRSLPPSTSPHPVPRERVHAELFSSQGVRVPRRRQAGRRDRPTGTLWP